VPLVSICAPPSARNALAQATLFHGFPDDLLDALAEVVDWYFIPGGEILYRRDDVGDSLFVVVSGRLRVVRDQEGPVARIIRDVGPGENVGELALITGERRSATVLAVRDTQLIRLSRAQFDALLPRHPRAVMQLARMLATWVRNSTLEVPPAIPELATVAVIPLTRDAPVHDFITRLAAAFKPRGRVLHLTAERVASWLGPSAAQAAEGESGYVEGTQWLSELEREWSLVIYESSLEPSAWARRCARQADRILAIAYAQAGPRDDQLTRTFFDAIAGHEAANAELVLLHDDETHRPRSSQAWRSLHPFVAHHHVRMASRQDFERLSRSLTGRAISLVLGGGGARAYAHIGVIRAIEEAGFPIDRLGGTSAGAFIAAQYAYGYSCDALVQLNRESWVSRLFLPDLTIPLVALFSSRRLKRIVQQSFGDVCIEDLWLPFFCVSTNLTRAEQVVHREGPLARWVRASLSMPGAAPPVLSPEGDLLVDGGLLNNVPVDVMRSLGDGPVIAVDVSPTVEFTFGASRQTAPGWRLMLRDLRRFEKKRAPTLLRILHRTMLLPSQAQRRRTQRVADLYLTPPVDGFDLFDWKAMDRIVEAGYRHAAAHLAEWRPDRAGPVVPGAPAGSGTGQAR
jgi:NTE family protein/lysophospholipid hydrolase